MATWKDVEESEPGFAARVRKIFDAHKHKTIATLRVDGAPRISAIEAEFDPAGELTFGSMPCSRKGSDLHRDGRFALHCAPVDPPEEDQASWVGDAKVAGRAIHAGPVQGIPGELFRADISEVVVTSLNASATMLVIESWTPQRGMRRVERE